MYALRIYFLFPGSCFNKGRYYKDKDMWNPLGSTSDSKVFQKPNCDLCVCQVCIAYNLKEKLSFKSYYLAKKSTT